MTEASLVSWECPRALDTPGQPDFPQETQKAPAEKSLAHELSNVSKMDKGTRGVTLKQEVSKQMCESKKQAIWASLL